MSWKRSARQITTWGNHVAEEAFKDFFIACYHMVDWIGEGANTDPDFDQVRTFVVNDPVLRFSEGFANTAKHHTRRRHTDMTAPCIESERY